MGLDMFVRMTKSSLPKPVDFDTEGLDSEELQYWRKFNNLHGWMERLYLEKGGQQEFNCVPVELTWNDLGNLERDAQAKENLKPVAGFFFGVLEELSDEDVELILAFVEKARKTIDQGYSIYYSSWW
jgi:hypothetical protein